MAGTIERKGVGRDDAVERDEAGQRGDEAGAAETPSSSFSSPGARLWAAWRVRADDDARLDGAARALLESGDERAPLLAAEVLRHALADEAAAGAGASDASLRTAAAIGRGARETGVDLGALRQLFEHLHDALFARLLHAAPEGGDELAGEAPLARAEVERRARRARATSALAAAADAAWLDEFERTLRHDIKTPLQAASLNLELLTLESAERGLDTEPLETIQRSLDQAVDMLRRLERTDG